MKTLKNLIWYITSVLILAICITGLIVNENPGFDGLLVLGIASGLCILAVKLIAGNVVEPKEIELKSSEWSDLKIPPKDEIRRYIEKHQDNLSLVNFAHWINSKQ